jgi:hypothetical protein
MITDRINIKYEGGKFEENCLDQLLITTPAFAMRD